MHTVSYRRHRFPREVIQHAVWLYFRFPLSFRDVEDLLAERGVGVVTLSDYCSSPRARYDLGCQFVETGLVIPMPKEAFDRHEQPER